MTESKFKRIVISSVITAILFVFILVTLLVYQLISIGQEKKAFKEYEAKIEYNRTLNDSEEDKIEARKTARWIIDRARELGYVLPDDIIIN